MKIAEALRIAEQIALKSGYHVKDLTPQHFDIFASNIAYIVKQWPETHKVKLPWLKDFLITLHKAHDNYEYEFLRDPMIAYRPKHRVSEQFHESQALYRYFSGGKRSSKSTSGLAEVYWVLTGYHPYRPEIPDKPHNTFSICGLPYQQYVPSFFEPKLLFGEDGNKLSPIFPINGKWFYKYDKKEHLIVLGCKECAEKGKAQSCPSHHMKSSHRLLSSEVDLTSVESFTATMWHFDEHVEKPFFEAAKARIADKDYGFGIITATPSGLENWEEEDIKRIAMGDPELNRTDINDPTSPPYATFHTISMRDAGIVSKKQIKGMERTMSPFEIMTAIDGKAAPRTNNPAFDNSLLYELEKDIQTDSEFGALSLRQPELGYSEVVHANQLLFANREDGMLRVWEQPIIGAKYVIGVDTAAGITKRDASCSQVIRLDPQDDGTFKHTQVAILHGRLNPHEYAQEIFKLGVWYEYCPLSIEVTGGLGYAVLLKLKDIGYANIFSGPRSLAATTSMAGNNSYQLGVDTNVSTKPAMIGALQHLLLDKRLQINCSKTIFELQAYEQKPSESGRNFTFQGTKGAHDDRVMALALAIYPVWLYPSLFLKEYYSPLHEEKRKQEVDKTFNHEYADFSKWFDVSEGDPFS